jgi:hypothetical protein
VKLFPVFGSAYIVTDVPDFILEIPSEYGIVMPSPSIFILSSNVFFVGVTVTVGDGEGVFVGVGVGVEVSVGVAVGV